ncbi:MAG: ATP-binding protein [Hespellia sp.]|nr:ATP-binding protein [Hespellia sp.]
MKNKHHIKLVRLICILTVSFLVIAGIGLFFGCRSINENLLTANKNMAQDMVSLVENNFHITDEEAAYMRTLTFNEMEIDPINRRLMDVGDSVQLHTDIRNVFVLAALSDDEIKYQTDKETSEFFGYEENTPLNGVWLLNGEINEDGRFEPREREDIYRYTHLTDEQQNGIRKQKGFTEFSADAWGNFITGYVPLYTVEGNFVGLLGIDMDPDKYQNGARNMMFVLFMAFFIVAIATVGLFLVFYYKYIEAKEGQLYFDFYSRMSHDMRTPMNGILGMAVLSKDENDVDVLHRNFEQVEQSGQYMLGLIDDTLDIQKLEAGKLRFDPKIRQCKDILGGLEKMMKLAADKKGIRLEVINKNLNLDCYVRVDELRMQQILMNIASNAIKFTPEGGTVTFTVESLGRDDNMQHGKFQISDTGIGMSEKFMKEHLFQPFEQEMNSVTTQYGGSGLGLSIVERLVQLMGGRIEVESTLGEGTTFTVYVDCELVDESEVQRELHDNDAKTDSVYHVLAGKRMLLAEDHHLNAEIAIRLLEKMGAKIFLAKNGQEAVDMFSELEEGTFDLILMDIRMPVMDGLTAAKTIRNMPRRDAKDIPIIAMTANAYEEDINNCIRAGMNDHIAKPIDPKVMYQTIAKTMVQYSENNKI